MTSRPGERGRSKMARRLLAAGLTMAMGYTSGVLTLRGLRRRFLALESEAA
jgi:hypothetical protein